MMQRLVWYLELGGSELEWLEAMVDFAAGQGASLRIVFVEDEVLLRCGELPCSREISLLTGQARAFSREQLAGQLRRRRERAEQRLAVLARQRTLEWSREVARGRREQLLSTPGNDMAVLTLAEGEPLPTWLGGLARPLLLLGPRFRPLTQLLVALDEAGDTELLEQGRALARQSGWPLWVLVPAAHTNVLAPVLAQQGLSEALLPLPSWSLTGWLTAVTNRGSLLLARADSPALTNACSTGINAILLLPGQTLTLHPGNKEG